MSLFCNDVLLPSWGKLAVAEVLLVIWTQWSRKPSDREISVSVRERANGKRQQENEKRATAPGLRWKTDREADGSPVVRYGLPGSGGSFKGAAAVLLSSGLPAKACSLCFLSEESSNPRAILLPIFLSEESLPSFLAEVKWDQGQLGHMEVIALATTFLSLWRVLMLGLTQHAGEPAPNRKGQDGNIQVEFAALSFIRFSPETGNE